MPRASWILPALVLAAAPVACFVAVDSSGGPGGNNGPTGSGSGTATGGAGSGTASGGAGGGAATGGGSASGDQCNPVTGAGCPSDGSTCDLATSGIFVCFPPPNTVDVCGACDDNAAFCGSDLTCVLPTGGNSGMCYRYCCSDADCGAGGTCDTAFGASVLQIKTSSDVVGLCVTNTTDDLPACGPPATAPSGGACVGGYAGGDTPDAGPPPPADGGSPSEDGGSPPEDGGSPSGDAGRPPSDAGSGFGGFGDGGHAGRHDGGFGG